MPSSISQNATALRPTPNVQKLLKDEYDDAFVPLTAHHIVFEMAIYNSMEGRRVPYHLNPNLDKRSEQTKDSEQNDNSEARMDNFVYCAEVL